MGKDSTRPKNPGGWSRDLRGWLEKLTDEGELKVVTAKVECGGEIQEIGRQMSARKGPAVSGSIRTARGLPAVTSLAVRGHRFGEREEVPTRAKGRWLPGEGRHPDPRAVCRSIAFATSRQTTLHGGFAPMALRGAAPARASSL